MNSTGTLARGLRLFTDSVRDLLGIWLPLAKADVIYKAVAFAVLTPLISLLLRLLIERTGAAAVADVDIALFFFTTRVGSLALILVSALIVAVTALEQACLMTIALGRQRGRRTGLKRAFMHTAARAHAVVRVAVVLVVRVLVLLLPFAAVAGGTYWVLLRGHDINFYLADRPPAFWAAAAMVAAIVLVLAVALARRLAGWALVLPLVIFEGLLPILAFGESRRRMQGRRLVAATAFVLWGAVALALTSVTGLCVKWIGRTVAPFFADSMGGLLFFIGVFLAVWGVLALAVAVVTAALFALLVVRLYSEGEGAGAAELPRLLAVEPEIRAGRFRVSWKALVAGVAAYVVLATGAAYFALRTAWTERSVLVIAHRGASEEAPENSLLAFKRAGEERTDYVELDVQETSDGVVVVAHDSDLMRLGHSPLKIWEATAEQIMAVDVGSFLAPEFKDVRVPTLAEALATCKGVSRVDIELKDYGHDERLEERVIELVEAAGMQDQIVTMSLSPGMVAKMKRLRPEWTSGLLTAKAVGDLSRAPADFLAVESRMATRRFVRSAHRHGKPVYVWTVNDANRMVRLMGLGVDGLITNRPELAKEVIARYAEMNQASRLFLFVMTRLGAHEEISEPEDDLRP